MDVRHVQYRCSICRITKTVIVPKCAMDYFYKEYPPGNDHAPIRSRFSRKREYYAKNNVGSYDFIYHSYTGPEIFYKPLRGRRLPYDCSDGMKLMFGEPPEPRVGTVWYLWDNEKGVIVHER